ncbi:MAG: DNA polymerase IV [Hyphomicrobiales bacterium]|nr:DNA polymerase IV [Hyphomicrobiales bacterium]
MSGAGAPICRDCLAVVAAGAARCRACGSPRLLVHPERDALPIAHIDCDAFYAAVEKRDDPSLRDKPLIVGGGKRGVVSTCCYIARTYGVRSAMPMFKARALCPDAVILKPNMAKYAEVGREVRRRMLTLTPLVEPLSIDEAFLDLSGTERLHHGSPAATLARFAAQVERELGITVSVGLSYCKFLAKLASDMDKPRGFSVIGRAEAKALLAPMAVGRIWGVGKVAADRLASDGLSIIADIQAREEVEMIRRHGQEGQRLWRLANGIDHRAVSPDREAKSISSETTFETDISDADTLLPVLHALCEKVAGRLKKADLAGRSITLKLKTADFRTKTRSRSGLRPTQLAARIFPIARELLAPEIGQTRYRLIGVGVGDLMEDADADQADLADPDVGRLKAAEAAMDAIRAKFGGKAVVKGIGLDKPRN